MQTLEKISLKPITQEEVIQVLPFVTACFPEVGTLPKKPDESHILPVLETCLKNNLAIQEDQLLTVASGLILGVQKALGEKKNVYPLVFVIRHTI